MIHSVMEMLRSFVATELETRFGVVPCEITFLGQTGDLPSGSVIFVPLNICREHHLRNAPPARNGSLSHVEPAKLGLKINFAVLSTTATEATALEHLSHVAAIFHENRAFDTAMMPASVAAHNEKLFVDLLSPTYEELNQIWSPYQRKMLPSLYYAVQTLFLGPPAEVSGPAIQTVTADVDQGVE